MHIKSFANHIGWTDVNPFEVVRVISEQTVEVREMKAHPLPWDQKWEVGGFAGHCSNQRDQKWDIQRDLDAEVIRIRWSKAKGVWQDRNGRRFSMSDAPRKFYDYNF